MPGPLIHCFLEENACRLPHKVALVHREIRATYGEINAWANGLSRRLTAEGVGSGGRVVLFLDNGLEFVIGWFAALKAGAVVVPVCCEQAPHVLAGMMRKLEPCAYVTSTRYLKVLIKAEVLRPATVLIGPDQAAVPDGRSVPWNEVLSAAEGENPGLPIADEALAVVIHTSGSTGAPKGVMLSHRNVVSNALSIVEYLHLTERDIQMVVLPFYYVMGMSLLTTHCAVGGTIVINNRFAFPADVIEQMITEQVTGFSGVPSTYTYLLHRSPLAECRERLASLRYCTQAGGHLPRRTKEDLMRVLPPQTRLYVMYGATEAAARLAYVEPERLRDKIDSIGKPIPGVALTIRDPQGREVTDGEVGEIVASGPNIMLGYWGDSEGTAKVLDAHGYHTGDLGYRDREGYFYTVGRKDNLLKIGGHRINPEEVEDALMGTELLMEVAVLGVRDQLLEPRLVAVAAPRHPGCSEQEVLRRCVAMLPKYKMPSAVKLVGSLPKTPQGKLDSRKCHDLAQSCLQSGIAL